MKAQRYIKILCVGASNCLCFHFRFRVSLLKSELYSMYMYNRGLLFPKRFSPVGFDCFLLLSLIFYFLYRYFHRLTSQKDKKKPFQRCLFGFALSFVLCSKMQTHQILIENKCETLDLFKDPIQKRAFYNSTTRENERAHAPDKIRIQSKRLKQRKRQRMRQNIQTSRYTLKEKSLFLKKTL